MSDPLFYAEPGALAERAPGSTVVLTGAEAHHAGRVRRLAAGASVALADGSGLVAHARVESVAPGNLVAVIESVRDATPPLPRLVLVQALVKDGRDERAVEAATELGVDEVVPWQAGRCVVRWSGPRGERARAKWASLVRAAAKQSRRATVPVVAEAVDTPALAARLRAEGVDTGVDAAGPGGGGAEGVAAAWVLHEDAAQPLAGPALEAAGRRPALWLIVGPEGGIGADELALLTGAGAVPVRLGAEILRAGTAGPAALAACLAATRWRSSPRPVD